VARHAQASRVVVLVTVDEAAKALTVRVDANGIGIPEATKPRGRLAQHGGPRPDRRGAYHYRPHLARPRCHPGSTGSRSPRPAPERRNQPRPLALPEAKVFDGARKGSGKQLAATTMVLTVTGSPTPGPRPGGGSTSTPTPWRCGPCTCWPRPVSWTPQWRGRRRSSTGCSTSPPAPPAPPAATPETRPQKVTSDAASLA
jgi:hypothetical protein